MAEGGNFMHTILVVDDQEGIRFLLKEVFKGGKYRVVTAADGAEALTKWEEWGPDLVLLDMKMPGLDGLDVLRKLAEKHRQVPVIMMTAYGELQIVEEALGLGAKGYITKPFDILELRQTVDTILAGAGK